MEKPKAVIFDYGDTIIEYNNIDYLKATKTMLEHANNPNNISAETICDFANQLLLELYGEENENVLQISSRSFNKLIYETFGVSFRLSPEELELILMNTAESGVLKDGIVQLLDYFADQKIKIGLLSNSGFSQNALRIQLREFGIEHYFEFVISTEEYCIRKPDKRIFNLALTKLNLPASEAWYVGNSFKYDVMGANNASLVPLWYNVDNLKPDKDIFYYNITSYKELLCKLKELE